MTEHLPHSTGLNMTQRHGVASGEQFSSSETQKNPIFYINIVRSKYPQQEGTLSLYLEGLARVGEYKGIKLPLVTAIRIEDGIGIAESGVEEELAILIGEKPFTSKPEESLPQITFDYLRSKLNRTRIDITEQTVFGDSPEWKDVVRCTWTDQREVIDEVFANTQQQLWKLQEQFGYHQFKYDTERTAEQDGYETARDELLTAAIADLKSLLHDTSQLVDLAK